MTRAEFESDQAQKKQNEEVETNFKKANDFVESLRSKPAGKDLPKFSEPEVIEFMRANGIFEPTVAYKMMNEAKWIDYNIKLAKGSTSYKSEKNGERIEPKKKEFNVRNPEDARNAILDDIKGYKGE